MAANNRATFRKEIEEAINRCSMENGSNTPDFILAKFLCACLDAFDAGARERETWYGRNDRPGDQKPARSDLAATKEASAEARLKVEWIVNNLAELGVKVGDQFFFLYKGKSYQGGSKWRPVFKREFGECCHPLGMETLTDDYTSGDENWIDLPWACAAHPAEGTPT